MRLIEGISLVFANFKWIYRICNIFLQNFDTKKYLRVYIYIYSRRSFNKLKDNYEIFQNSKKKLRFLQSTEIVLSFSLINITLWVSLRVLVLFRFFSKKGWAYIYYIFLAINEVGMRFTCLSCTFLFMVFICITCKLYIYFNTCN